MVGADDDPPKPAKSDAIECMLARGFHD